MVKVKEESNSPAVETPDGETKPESEKVTTEETTEEAPATEAYFDQLRQEMVSKGVDFTEMDSKIHRGESLSEEEIALVAEHTPFPPTAIKAFTDLLGKNLQLLQYKTTQEEAALEVARAERMKAIDEVAGGSYKELAEQVATSAPASKVALWRAAIEGSDDLEVHKAVASEMKAFADNLSEQAPAPDKRSDLGVLTKSSASQPGDSSQNLSGSAGDVDVPQALEAAARLEAEKEQEAKEAIVAKMTADQLAQVRRIGQAHPLYLLVDARLNQLLNLTSPE